MYDFFIAVGFEMSEEYAELPEKNVDLELLRRTRDLLEKKLHDLSSKKVRKFDLTGSFGSGFASAKSQTSAVDLNMKIFRDNGFLNPSIRMSNHYFCGFTHFLILLIV